MSSEYKLKKLGLMTHETMNIKAKQIQIHTHNYLCVFLKRPHSKFSGLSIYSYTWSKDAQSTFLILQFNLVIKVWCSGKTEFGAAGKSHWNQMISSANHPGLPKVWKCSVSLVISLATDKGSGEWGGSYLSI